MIKKILFAGAFSILVFTFSVQAQSQKSSGNNTGSSDYKNAVGLTVDLGSTIVTGAGVGFKHFFSEHDAAEVNLLFYNNVFSLGAYYEYHGLIQNADGLKWYAGMGPQVFFGQGATDLAARALIGLDYKIPTVPLDFSFDWRPALSLTNGTEFIAARFGIGLRFAFGK